MTETTYNSIKNRNMIGPNGFKYDMTIEDVEEVYFGQVESSVITVTQESPTSSDHVVLPDGRVLYVYAVNDTYNVKYHFFNDLEDFKSQKGPTQTGTWGPNDPSFHVLNYPNGTFDLNKISINVLTDGSFIILIADGPDSSYFEKTEVDKPYSIKCFRSTTGSMEDLSMSIVYEYDFDQVLYGPGGFVNKPRQDSTGRVYFCGCTTEFVQGMGGVYEALFPSYYNDIVSIFYSDDMGITWVKAYSYGSETRSPYYDRPGDILIIEQPHRKLIFTTMCGHDDYTFIVGSMDGGATWAIYDFRLNVNGPYLENRQWYVGLFKDNLHLWMIRYTDSGQHGLYSFKITLNFNLSDLNDNNKWTLKRIMPHVGYEIFEPGDYQFRLRHITVTPETVYIGAWWNFHYVLITMARQIDKLVIDPIHISISKSKGGANTATLKVDNKNGIVNPRNPNSSLYGLLNINKQINIKLGYGSDLVDSFVGLVDSISMSTFPQVADIKLRDSLKRALDQTLTKNGSQVVKYSKQPIENIVADICNLCGLVVGKIEPTGISIEKEFNWQTYADAIQFLSDIASFEYLIDESGLFYFRRDYQPGDMEVAWSFEEGVDIQDLTYSIDDVDLYSSIRVYGKSGDTVLVYNAPFLDAPEFNILPQKVMKIDATETSTTSELKKIAERAVATMRSRSRVINFTAIAIPHLQVGDFIQLFESSTNTHEIYRLSSINLSMTKDSFTMSCSAYYYGDALVPGELPDAVAVQTPNPNLNLIPNMTSNTKPSGVARSSSVYKLYNITYSPWRAFNNDSSDYFWDLSTKTGWIEYEFTEKTIVDKYKIKARQDLTWNKALPKAWTFEAFDGTSWVVLDKRTEQKNWGIYEERSYLFVNTTPYIKYRLRVSDNNGYVRTQIEQMSMHYGGGS